MVSRTHLGFRLSDMLRWCSDDFRFVPEGLVRRGSGWLVGNCLRDAAPVLCCVSCFVDFTFLEVDEKVNLITRVS